MTEANENDADIEPVGYGKPPKRTQFKKGQSGNPKGRRKGSGVRSAVEEVLENKVTMTVDGVRRKVPITVAMVTQLAQRGLAGDATASRDFLKIVDQAAHARAEQEIRETGTTVVIRRFGDPKGCNGALEVLGVTIETSDGGGQLKVQSWVVEAALARGQQMTEADRALVAEFTVKGADVPTPRVRP